MEITEIRCSKLDRPMKCAGSLSFDVKEEEGGEAAKEGTAFGEYFASLLVNAPFGTHASNGVMIDEDMKFYAADMCADVKARAATPIICEQKIFIQTRSGIRIPGSSDAAYIDHEGALCIDDSKYGWKIVEEKENWQLLGYAIGEILRRNQYFPFIKMRILQPRPHHEDGPYREWKVSYEQLLEYKEKIEQRMELIKSGNRELVTGPQCKYCPAAPEACPAFNRSIWAGVDYIVNDFFQDKLSDREISFQLDLFERMNDLMKIKYDSLKSLAVQRLKTGSIIPNYMMENSYGDRKWKNGISPKVIETLTGKKIIKQEMMSPNQAEKAGVPRKLIDQYVDRFFIGPKVVRKDANKLGEKIFGTGKG